MPPDDRRRVGVDVVGLLRIPRVPLVPLPRVLRGVLRRGLQGAPGRLLGDPSVGGAEHLPQLGLPHSPPDLQRVPLCEGCMNPAVQIDAFLTQADLEEALRTDVARGLTSSPKELPPKYFYDARGSQLFDEITRLEEYYPTRREREILMARAGDVAATGADTLVELGSGTSEKTRLLLDAMASAGHLRRFIPFDVDEVTLGNAADAVASEYEGIEIHAIVGDFEHHLGRIPVEGKRVIAFLGGTIGNLFPVQRAQFLADLADDMRAGDALLLGTDLVKDIDRLEAAYDDRRGVTAEFNRNVLRVVNRRLGADYDLDRFTPLARFDKDNEWI